MKDPASLEAQHEAEDELDKVLIALSVSILAVIARRLKDVDSIRNVYASMPSDIYQIEQLTQTGRELLNQTMREIFEDMGQGNDAWAKRYYKAANVKQIRTANHPTLKPIITDGLDDAIVDASKLVNTSAMGIVIDDAGTWLPIRDAYMQIVGNAANQMIRGEAAFQDVAAQKIRTLARVGLRFKYPRQTRELYSAVTMKVMDSYRTAMVDARMEMGKEFGADGVEVSAHVPCAPDHEEYQGMQYSNEEWRYKQYEPSRPLVIGANCMHTTYPVIMGVSSAYSKSQIAEMNRKSREKVKVKGVGYYARKKDGSLGEYVDGKVSTMTRYEASQYQRRIEQSLRNANTERYLLSENAKDTKALEKAIKQRTREYKRISKEAGLPVRMDRTKVYTL